MGLLSESVKLDMPHSPSVSAVAAPADTPEDNGVAGEKVMKKGNDVTVIVTMHS